MRNLSLATFLVLSFLLLAQALPITAPRACCQENDTARRLERQKQRAMQARQALQQLTAEERRMHESLAEYEQQIKELAGRIEEEEKELRFLEASEKDVAQTLEKLEQKRRRSMQDLRQLLQKLWPVQVRREVLSGRTLPAWEQTDREFVWMASVYGQVQSSLRELRTQERAIAKTLERKRELAATARARLAAVNDDKDALLEQRLQFRRELAAVRKQKLSREEELEALMALVNQLGYKLEKKQQAAQREQARNEKARLETKRREAEKLAALARQPFKSFQGKLPWPAKGRVVAGYSPTAKPPQRGLGFSLGEGEPVHAVSWGRVVHNDVLRGFGRVVILLHGEDYYSVYAYLSSSDLKKGQDVARGDVIGRAGYYPQAKGPGVYFELRFQQKPINPRQWLIARK